MSSPPITAVVPTHNRPEMMRRAVESILAQEYDGPIEVIVVFDACEPVLPEVRMPKWPCAKSAGIRESASDNHSLVTEAGVGSRMKDESESHAWPSNAGFFWTSASDKT